MSIDAAVRAVEIFMFNRDAGTMPRDKLAALWLFILEVLADRDRWPNFPWASDICAAADAPD